jgi:sugar/nucleoside kinase (ribokinase family)
MKRITALTHPLIDILHTCTPQFLRQHGLTPGSYGLLSKSEQDALIHSCGLMNAPMSLGGSVANSILCARQLGIPATLLGLAGEDSFGHHLHHQMRLSDIHLPLPLVADARTGTCLSLITPDGERTMRTCLGVATTLAAEHVLESSIASSAWLVIEGYFLTASDQNSGALRAAIQAAKQSGTKVAFTASAEFVIHAKRDEIVKDILPHSDLILANAGEAMLLTGTSSSNAALEALSNQTPMVVITCGKDGAVGAIANTTWRIPASAPTSPVVDTTGAGDIFAGAFIAGLMHGLPPEIAARGAARLASIIITRFGSQLPTDARALWDQEISTATS